jgi:oligopeptidase A
MANPLLTVTHEFPFAELRPDQVEPAIAELLAEAQAKVDAIGADPDRPRTYASTLQALEAATERLEFAMTIVEHMTSVATTPELRTAHNAVVPNVSAFWSSIPLNAELWSALREFSTTDEARALTGPRKRLLEKTIDEFRRHGAELDDGGKARLKAIDQELSLLTTKFGQNVLDSTNAFELVVPDDARLAGLPESAKEAARESAKSKGQSGYRFTLQAPSVTAALTYADDRALREQIWRAYDQRATTEPFDNRPLIGKILELRREKARLLGFDSFADLVLQDRMAKSGAEAHAFVQELTTKTTTAFEREHQELLQFVRDTEGSRAPPELAPWDVTYYAEKQRRARYNFDEEQLRPYFPAEQVLEGAFRIAEQLYAVRFDATTSPAWDAAVRGYRVIDADGSLLGLVYVDLYPRENKNGGAWMHGLLAAVPPRPHLAIMCANSNPPVGGKPSLLTHRDVETLFHEFGHLLHHCLSRVPVRSLSCTRVAQDFVELPSQIMENWCYERDALDTFARHYETGELLPAALFERVIAARNYRAGTMQMRQLGFAAVDLALHTEYGVETHGDVVSFARQVLQRYAPARYPDDYAMIASFSHLFSHSVGYAAGYYSYKWAEVLDADAFSRFKREGILNPSVGRDFRQQLLSQGDSADPMELFVSFMGRRPRMEALLEREGLLDSAAE